MSKVHRTARGDAVDMDMIRLSNESTIAIGNMKTNARGDQLGPGGKVVKTRAQVMQEYHKLNTNVPEDIPIGPAESTRQEQAPITNLTSPVAIDGPITDTPSTPQYVKPRGSFAESIAEQTEITQELLEPATSRNSPTGITRI